MGDEINFDIDFIPIEVEKANFHNLFQSLSYSNERMHIDFGNRSSYYLERNSWFHSPRINLKYTINKSITFKADAGIYHQFVSQLTNVGAYQIKVDNPLWIMNAKGVSLSQSASKIAAGVVFQKGKWLLDIDFYNNRINNISTITPQLGIIPEISGFTAGESTVTGMDLLLKKGWSSRINTWLNYSLAYANYSFPDISQDNFNSPTDIRHNISFVSSYKYKNFQLASTINYHSGLPYSRAQLTLNEFDPYPEPPFLYYLNYDELNGERLNPYLRLDFNASYRFNFKPIKESQIEISCSLLNLLNRSNVVAREFFVNYNDSTEEYKLTSIQKTLLNRTSLLLLRYYW